MIYRVCVLSVEGWKVDSIFHHLQQACARCKFLGLEEGSCVVEDDGNISYECYPVETDMLYSDTFHEREGKERHNWSQEGF